MKKIARFTLVAVAALLVLTGCNKDHEVRFELGVHVLLIQKDSPTTGNPLYHLSLGMFGFNEELDPVTASITHNGMPVLGSSIIPNAYEKDVEYRSDPISFNGTYTFTANSTKLSQASLSVPISLSNSPLQPFDIEDYSHQNGRISCTFKNIDPDAIMCGFHIVPIIKNSLASSDMLAIDLVESIPMGNAEHTFSASFEMSSDYESVIIYPAIVKINNNNTIYQIYIKELPSGAGA